MSYSEELKKIRKNVFCLKKLLGEKWGSFSSIKRWKGGKSKPNMNAMKKLKNFCDIHDVCFTTLEEQWND